MADHLEVRGIQFFPAPEAMQQRGLVCWAEFTYGCVRFHGVALRRTRKGEYALSFPRLRAENGQVRCATRPINDEARHELEAPIVAEARRMGLLQ